MDDVILIGAGGHAKVLADLVIAAGGRVIGLLDDRGAGCIPELSVLGPVADAVRYPSCKFLIAIGNNEVRARIAGEYKLNWFTAVHPSAIVSPSAVIGEGTVVLANAVINASARIGRHVIVNTAAVAEHDTVVEDFCHLSPRSVLGGTVFVGEGTQIGIGAVVINNINICGHCMIGGGAAVVRDITDPGTYVGVPARRLHQKMEGKR